MHTFSGANEETPIHGRKKRRSWFIGEKLLKLSVKIETFRGIALFNIFTELISIYKIY